MTRFLGVQAVLNLVRTVGIDEFMIRLADSLRADLCRWEEFTKSPRVANYFANGVLELMPVSDSSLYSFKYVNGHPKNTSRSLPTVMAFSVLAEVECGTPLLVAEATICTAFRTAAMSALAAAELARKNARTMALIGCGAQSEFQAVALRAICSIETIRHFDIDAAAMDKFESNMGFTHPGLALHRAASVEDALEGSDVITLATAQKHHAAILRPELVLPGLHVNGIGGDCPGKTEIHPDVLERATVFVEYEPQTRHEGDLQQLSPDFEVTEIWKVVAGLAPGRTSPEEVTIFDSVGFALADFSTMRLLYDLMAEGRPGQELDLIATPADPKDLYGMLLE